MITEFRGNYCWLSNMYEVPVEYNGIRYRCSEAAYQAQKDTSRAKEFINLSGKEARRLGRRVNMSRDFQNSKIEIMAQIVLQKFLQNENLASKLLETGDEHIIEGNWWNDTFWGVCNGSGSNYMGIILMCVRNVLIKMNE